MNTVILAIINDWARKNQYFTTVDTDGVLGSRWGELFYAGVLETSPGVYDLRLSIYSNVVAPGVHAEQTTEFRACDLSDKELMEFVYKLL